MKLADVPRGESIFVDANIFIYAFAPEPNLGPPCQQFLERIDSGELRGVTSAHVLSNVAHRLMSLEACQTYGWPYKGIASRLARHPAEVRQLYRFHDAVEAIVTSGIQVAPIGVQHVLDGNSVCGQFGLLCNDSLIVAILQEQQLTHLASHDSDFDHVPGILRYSPA